jgi:hypothetical protein
MAEPQRIDFDASLWNFRKKLFFNNTLLLEA